MKKRGPKKHIPMFFVLCFFSLANAAVSAGVDGTPSLAKWYKDNDAAVSLRFDDNHASHLETVIPLLEKYNIRATFMVSPGKSGYHLYKESWETEVPAMGHRLGNHTMHHSGAEDIADAEYEIGQAAKILRQIYPDESKLMVFASGGGEKWGGRNWETADPAYHQLVDQYNLIDLYDGDHASFRIDGASRIEEVCGRLDTVMDTHGYQPFHFHSIGKPGLMERIKTVVRGYELGTSKDFFKEFLKCITARQDRLWVAPIIEILKYEKEQSSAALRVLESKGTSCTVELTVQTDPILYDHPLTLKIPVRSNMIIERILQGNDEKAVYQQEPEEYLVDVEPVNSVITIRYHFI